LDDAAWVESLIKVSSYAPWGRKLYLNGREWLKRQLIKEGIGFESLANGFLNCPTIIPAALGCFNQPFDLARGEVQPVADLQPRRVSRRRRPPLCFSAFASSAFHFVESLPCCYAPETQ
jgi:hypothetical protein